MFNDNTKPFTLNKIFHTFFLFFMGLAPAFQFKNDIVLWGGKKLETIDYFYGNILIIAILLLYNIFYIIFYYKKESIRTNKSFKFTIREPILGLKSKKFLLFASLFSFFIFFLSRKFIFLSLVIRSSSDLSQSINLIIDMFLRPIPIICLVFYKIFYKKFTWTEVILLLVALISNLPIAMSRFQAAALYIPVVLVYFPILRKNINFSLAITAGFLLVFPFLNQFRSYNNADIVLNFDSELFLQGDFDSYQNFIQIIKAGSITYGNQLLGVFFFFVPRSYWPTKPIGSGSQMAEDMHLIFPNISMNFFAEGYVNFGYLGIFLFIILFAYLNTSLDKTYWKYQQNNFIKITFPFLIGMEFFMLRGYLLSSFAYTCGLLVAILFVYMFVTKKTSN